MIRIELKWKTLLFEGIALTLLGVLALLNPFVMSLGLDLLLGFLLVAAGLIQGYRALKNIKNWDSVPVLIGASFALIAGILLLAYPLTGVLTLALLLTIFFFVDGISKIITSFQYRSFQGWGWILFSGIISVFLALLIYAGLPISAAWIIGVYLGIYFLILGFSMIMLSFYVKKAVIIKRQ
jgi:uncharacterized membrane protein HdeD (DUF308 family)